jgi:amino acid transporter
VIATYAIGRGGTGLGDQWSYVLLFTLVALWTAALINIVGLTTGKWLQNVGGAGSYITGAVLVVVAIVVVASTHHGPINPITRETLVPHLGSFATVNLWASIAFAFSGIELIATMGGEIRDPRRTLPRSILISVPFIVLLYLAGTTAVLWLVPTRDTNVVSGVLQGIAAGTAVLGPGFRWLVPAAAAAYTIGTIGCIGTWLVGPARVAFAIGLDRYFPPAFGRVHPRWHTPYVAILVEAGLATLLLLFAVPGKGTTVESLFLVLLDMNLLVYFIPFIYIFLCLIAERDDAMAEGRKRVIPCGYAGRVVTALSGLAVTIAAMIVAAVPPPDAHPVWLFELKVVGGAALFVLLGEVIYVLARARSAATPLAAVTEGQP